MDDKKHRRLWGGWGGGGEKEVHTPLLSSWQQWKVSPFSRPLHCGDVRCVWLCKKRNCGKKAAASNLILEKKKSAGRRAGCMERHSHKPGCNYLYTPNCLWRLCTGNEQGGQTASASRGGNKAEIRRKQWRRLNLPVPSPNVVTRLHILLHRTHRAEGVYSGFTLRFQNGKIYIYVYFVQFFFKV